METLSKIDLLGNWPESVFPQNITTLQPGLKTQARCKELHTAMGKVQKMMTSMKLEIELETETVTDQIKGGKTYISNGSYCMRHMTDSPISCMGKKKRSCQHSV